MITLLRRSNVRRPARAHLIAVALARAREAAAGAQRVVRLPDRVDEAVGAGHLADLARRVDASLSVHARVFDVYRGKGLSEGKKSVAVRFSIQSAEGTLSEKEANRWLKRYQELALDQFGAQLRG